MLVMPCLGKVFGTGTFIFLGFERWFIYCY